MIRLLLCALVALLLMPSRQDELLSTAQAAAVLAMKPSTLAKWRVLDEGPPYVRVGKSIKYSRADLAEWLRGQRVLPGVLGR